ncbi:glycosyltransferase [Halomonas sp. MCCC 1A17488]|uniref:glycosyltransferase family 2 protein n=1 Tax=unclassified Halomonas TaxID=2609666 RepID=UPI0018D2683E|nr:MULTISPECIES: glycosyltransferase [unclassified Halomonas]MCE8014975.1 glycosyltransferase [Halomonas sp. MCCC 1A17488]MCG3238308.1 glycosyltransferase [Halomonas sp. MCCC 1A17488]QPP47939.1 glycosyltransferase [Halomonas sp. SS10-MC5]
MKVDMPEVVVSIIVPTYRDWHALRSCLDAMVDQTLPAQEFEILIVENAGETQPCDLTLPGNARLLHEPAPGSYAARNRGIAEARGDVLVFLDADCMAAPGWLQAGIECLQANPDVGLVAGNIELSYAASRLTPAECFEKAFAFRQRQNVANGVSVTANLFVRREVFDEVGVFDSGLMSGGDFEWTRRATSRGHRLLFCEIAVVRHPARSSIAALAGKARRVASGSQALYQERGVFGGLRRVLGNLVGDMASLVTRRDMTWRERAWALLVLAYLKAVKVGQRFRLVTTRHGRAELPR